MSWREVAAVAGGWAAGLGFPVVLYAAARIVSDETAGGGAGLFVYLGVVGFLFTAVCLLLSRRAPGAAAVMMLVAVLWCAQVWLWSDVNDDQAMHDRGVTATATVSRWIRTSDPFAGVDDKVTAVDVTLPGGTTTRLELGGERAPRVGGEVEVTRDPRGIQPSRLGPRPGEPTGLRTAARVVLVLLVGAALVGSLLSAEPVSEGF
ncbi:hypothetical protein [Streptomyces sp. NPDC055607]